MTKKQKPELPQADKVLHVDHDEIDRLGMFPYLAREITSPELAAYTVVNVAESGHNSKRSRHLGLESTEVDMPAPKGNKNAARGTQWRDAVRKAVLRDGKLEALAQALVARGLEGDMAALREIGDRLDGKVRQAELESGEEARFIVQWLAPDADTLREKLDAALEIKEGRRVCPSIPST